jgi:hypothetical protein
MQAMDLVRGQTASEGDPYNSEEVPRYTRDDKFVVAEVTGQAGVAGLKPGAYQEAGGGGGGKKRRAIF